MSLFSELKRRNVLRVAIGYLAASWLLIQIVETLFPIFGLSDASIRLSVILLAIGFPLILIFSWLYELTPEGLKLEKDVDRSITLVHHTGKKLDRAIIVVLALALGYFAFDKFVLDPARDTAREEVVAKQARTDALVESYGEKSIAVLPFVNMSDDAGNEYFADGISEELLNLLAQIPQLRVISRSSVFSFKGKDIDIPTLAERLNVAHVLEGSVRKSGNKVRITAQLIEARSDTHLWSASYDRELGDIFAIQDEIAADVVAQLKITLLGDAPKTRKTDPEAYALFLQARHLNNQWNHDFVPQAVAMLQRVLELDPDYVPAWNALSRSYYQLGDHELSFAAVDMALSIDPDDAVANAYRGWRYMEFEKNLVAAGRLFAHAIATDLRNENVLRTAIVFASIIGRQKEAIELGEYAVALNPLCMPCFYNLSKAYRRAGRFAEAEDRARTAVLLGLSMDYSIAKTLLLKGDARAALVLLEKLSPGYQKLHAMALAYYELGRQTEFAAAFTELRELESDDAAELIAKIYAWTGELDEAFRWLDIVLEKEDPVWITDYLNPFYRNLHADPRWHSFLEKLGRSPEQLAAIEFKVTLPE